MEETQKVKFSELVGLTEREFKIIYEEFMQYFSNHEDFSDMICEFLNSTKEYSFEEVFTIGYLFGRSIELNEERRKKTNKNDTTKQK